MLVSSIASLTEALQRLEGHLDGFEANRDHVRCEGKHDDLPATFNSGNRCEPSQGEPPIGFDNGED